MATITQLVGPTNDVRLGPSGYGDEVHRNTLTTSERCLSANRRGR